MDKMEELHLCATSDTLNQVLGSIEQHLQKNGWPKEQITPILIAAEEIYVNIVHYAYGGDAGEAVVQMAVDGDPTKVCRICFIDHGLPYNPLERESPDVTLSAEERDVGGLGIFMTQIIMDKVDYVYEDGCNKLTLEKYIQ